MRMLGTRIGRTIRDYANGNFAVKALSPETRAKRQEPAIVAPRLVDKEEEAPAALAGYHVSGGAKSAPA